MNIQKYLSFITRRMLRTTNILEKDVIDKFGYRHEIEDTIDGYIRLLQKLKNRLRLKRLDASSQLGKGNIFCQGSLLNTVQMNMVFSDSKTFVDMKLKRSANDIINDFNKFMDTNGPDPSKELVTSWVKDNFDKEGSEFEKWEPGDWVEKPKFLEKVTDPELREFGYQLNDLWKLLGRKIKRDVKDNPDLYSIMYVPNPVIVPGGRFREFYYWDSYWIVKALLLSEMSKTARGMMDNFLSLVDTLGFVPNGGRIYYSKRSQPPMLIPMMKVYYDFISDDEFIKESLPTMDKEFDFWLKHHTVSVTKNDIKYRICVYEDKSLGPRPESYREDVESARNFKTPEEQEEHYAEIKAAAESGWDFSSRWFIRDKTNVGTMKDIKTRYIAPVDLNAMIYGNARIMAIFHRDFKNSQKEEYYTRIADEWQNAIEELMWNEEDGCWYDYDLINGIQRRFFYPSNLTPLWFKIYTPEQQECRVEKYKRYIEKYRLLDYKGGVPSSFESTGQQWDFPNAWPPMQHMIVVGLQLTEDPELQNIAFQLAQNWVRSCYEGFQKTGGMFEKYDACNEGERGGGGEYEVQLGFGWSNAVVLDFLYMYGDRLTVN